MPKLAIYVPKAEMKKIDRWRKKINFSRIFMQALAREIRVQSGKVATGDDRVVAAARHYRDQLAHDEAPLAEHGFQLGADAVLECRLDPERIRELVDLSTTDSDSTTISEQVSLAMGKSASHLGKFARQHGYSDETHPMWEQSIYEGYLDGVKSAWSRVCEAMHAAS